MFTFPNYIKYMFVIAVKMGTTKRTRNQLVNNRTDQLTAELKQGSSSSY